MYKCLSLGSVSTLAKKHGPWNIILTAFFCRAYQLHISALPSPTTSTSSILSIIDSQSTIKITGD
jgi:hypothetical protein